MNNVRFLKGLYDLMVVAENKGSKDQNKTFCDF